MMVTVVIRTRADGRYEASAPDFPASTVTDADADTAFARLRLVIEGLLADLFLDGQPAPVLRPAGEWRQGVAATPGARWLEVHINVPHIEAVARHQRGRRS